MLAHPQAEFRQHRTVFQGQFAPGAAIGNAAVIRVAIPTASAGRFRFRFKCSVNGALNAAPLSPGILSGKLVEFENELDGTDPVATTGVPTQVAVTANVEAMIEMPDLSGEAYVLVWFTEEGVTTGTVTYANYCQL